MKIGIIGSGRIGGGIARQLANAGHELKPSFSRDGAALERLAREIGPGATVGTPADADEFGEVVVISVPWDVLPEALDQAGPLAGRVVIDTTNQFGSPPLPAEGETAAQFNARRMTGPATRSRSTRSRPAFRRKQPAGGARSAWSSGSAAMTLMPSG
jgi:predicted dinucleotide-binding enzyme